MQEIYTLQQDSKFVTSFYSEWKISWEDLEIYMHVPNCTCRVRCSCEFIRNDRHNQNLLYAIRFFTGLNDNFTMVKSQILLMDPLPPMNKIFSTVLQLQKQGNIASPNEDFVLINYADSTKFKGNYYGKSYSQGSNSNNCVVYAPFVVGTITKLRHVGRNMKFHHIFRRIIIQHLLFILQRRALIM